jgi:hypothetical protein
MRWDATDTSPQAVGPNPALCAAPAPAPFETQPFCPVQRPLKGWHASCCIEVVSDKKRSALFETSHAIQVKGNIMNIHKHMEAIFVVTLVVVSAGTFALDSAGEADAGQSASVSAARDNATANARAVVVRAPTLPQRA